VRKAPSRLFNSGGFSLIELLMSVGLLAVVMLGVGMFSQFAIKTVSRTLNSQERQSIGDSYEKMIMRSVFSVSTLKFDPLQTLKFDATTATGFSFVGSNWRVTKQDGNVNTYSVIQEFEIGTFTLKNDSHTIELYQFNRDQATQSVSKQTLAVLVSRCVDSKTWDSSAITFAQVLTLPRPYLQVSSLGKKAGYFCCDAGGACSGLNPLTSWPTTFYYTGGARVEQWPEAVARRTTPGLGFSLVMDRVEPMNYSLRIIRMSNVCLTSAVQVQGQCAETVEKSTNTDHYERDIAIQIKEVVKPVSNSLTGSSYINIGNAILDGP
jgi:Tfp pilus assembly protein PilV